jgi:hypothetical protein
LPLATCHHPGTHNAHQPRARKRKSREQRGKKKKRKTTTRTQTTPTVPTDETMIRTKEDEKKETNKTSRRLWREVTVLQYEIFNDD